MKIPLAKLKAILLYFTNNTNTKYLGKVKLMKLFYFLDFMHLKEYGLPITYDTYFKLEHGPIPTVIKNMVDEATENIEHSPLSEVIYFETPSGTVMNKCLPVRQFDENDSKLFTESELNTLERVCIKFGEYSTPQIETASHSEAAWKKTQYAQEIDFALAAEDNDCKFTAPQIKLMLELLS